MTTKNLIALTLGGAILLMVTGALIFQGDDPSDNATPTRPQPSAELLAQLEQLPAPEKIDDKNLDETMKVMGRAFRQIKTAKTTAEMTAPIEEMIQYAAQAELIGLHGASPELAQDFIQEMKILRFEIHNLHKKITADDFVGTQENIELLDQMRRTGHRHFKDF